VASGGLHEQDRRAVPPPAPIFQCLNRKPQPRHQISASPASPFHYPSVGRGPPKWPVTNHPTKSSASFLSLASIFRAAPFAAHLPLDRKGTSVFSQNEKIFIMTASTLNSISRRHPSLAAALIASTSTLSRAVDPHGTAHQQAASCGPRRSHLFPFCHTPKNPTFCRVSPLILIGAQKSPPSTHFFPSQNPAPFSFRRSSRVSHLENPPPQRPGTHSPSPLNTSGERNRSVASPRSHNRGLPRPTPSPQRTADATLTRTKSTAPHSNPTPKVPRKSVFTAPRAKMAFLFVSPPLL